MESQNIITLCTLKQENWVSPLDTTVGLIFTISLPAAAAIATGSATAVVVF